MDPSIPPFADVLLARKRIRPYLARTPLHTYPAVNELIGAEIYIKHENHQARGGFQGAWRGEPRLAAERRGASTGCNRGFNRKPRAVGCNAARLFGVEARIVVPERANPGKVAAMQGMGAKG